MKTKYRVLVILLLLLAGVVVLGCGAQDKGVIRAFKPIVAEVTETLATNRSMVFSKEHSTGEIWYVLKFKSESPPEPDIVKTDSLMNPYLGSIVVRLRVYSNGQYGNVWRKMWPERDSYMWGFKTREEAEKADNFCGCIHYDGGMASEFAFMERYCKGKVKLLYAYRDGKWRFTGLEAQDHYGEGVILNDYVRDDTHEFLMVMFGD